MDDLESALLWVDATEGAASQAFVSMATGQIHYASDELDSEEELPEDIDDGSLYVPVPTRRELDLGTQLVFRFVDARAPHLADAVSECFRSRGAYRRFHNLLDRTGLRDAWHRFDEEATRAALKAWAAENGITVADKPPT